LAPAADVEALPGRKYVTALLRARGFAADDVHAVHRDHREEVFAQAAAKRDLVFVAGTSDDVGLAVLPVHGQLALRRAIVDRDVAEAADGVRREAQRHGEQRGERVKRFHSVLPWPPKDGLL